MREFQYQEPFPLSKDATPYRLLTKDHVSVSQFQGQDVLQVDVSAFHMRDQHA